VASECEATRLPRTHAVLDAALHNIIAEHSNSGVLMVTQDVESALDDAGALIRRMADDGLADGAFMMNSESGYDFNPRRSLRRAARSRVEALVAANRRKDEFLALLSHELRSPLASIRNALHVLGIQAADTSVRLKMQALIERQVCRMTQLVDDLSDVARITHGRMRLQPEWIDLCVVVRNAIETLEQNIHERRHVLATAFPDEPVYLHADPRRLEQVFVNLIANASRYTDAGGRLTVWVHTRDGQAVVRIRDNGIGIAPEVLPHIFDLFRQADGAAPHSHGGLGIGLALVRNLLELHGGSVTAGSAGIGRGSEFTVRLPTRA
jgi:signal transduction histidine kinase